MRIELQLSKVSFCRLVASEVVQQLGKALGTTVTADVAKRLAYNPDTCSIGTSSLRSTAVIETTAGQETIDHAQVHVSVQIGLLLPLALGIVRSGGELVLQATLQQRPTIVSLLETLGLANAEALVPRSVPVTLDLGPVLKALGVPETTRIVNAGLATRGSGEVAIRLELSKPASAQDWRTFFDGKYTPRIDLDHKNAAGRHDRHFSVELDYEVLLAMVRPLVEKEITAALAGQDATPDGGFHYAWSLQQGEATTSIPPWPLNPGAVHKLATYVEFDAPAGFDGGLFTEVAFSSGGRNVVRYDTTSHAQLYGSALFSFLTAFGFGAILPPPFNGVLGDALYPDDPSAPAQQGTIPLPALTFRGNTLDVDDVMGTERGLLLTGNVSSYGPIRFPVAAFDVVAFHWTYEAICDADSLAQVANVYWRDLGGLAPSLSLDTRVTVDASAVPGLRVEIVPPPNGKGLTVGSGSLQLVYRRGPTTMAPTGPVRITLASNGGQLTQELELDTPMPASEAAAAEEARAEACETARNATNKVPAAPKRPGSKLVEVFGRPKFRDLGWLPEDAPWNRGGIVKTYFRGLTDEGVAHAVQRARRYVTRTHTLMSEQGLAFDSEIATFAEAELPARWARGRSPIRSGPSETPTARGRTHPMIEPLVELARLASLADRSAPYPVAPDSSLESKRAVVRKAWRIRDQIARVAGRARSIARVGGEQRVATTTRLQDLLAPITARSARARMLTELAAMGLATPDSEAVLGDDGSPQEASGRRNLASLARQADEATAAFDTYVREHVLRATGDDVQRVDRELDALLLSRGTGEPSSHPLDAVVRRSRELIGQIGLIGRLIAERATATGGGEPGLRPQGIGSSTGGASTSMGGGDGWMGSNSSIGVIFEAIGAGIADLFNGEEDDRARDAANSKTTEQLATISDDTIVGWINAMVQMPCTDDDEQAILTLLGKLECPRFRTIVRRVGPDTLQSAIDGAEHDQLLAMFARCAPTDYSKLDAEALVAIIKDASQTWLASLSLDEVQAICQVLFDASTGDDEEEAICRLLEAQHLCAVQALLGRGGMSYDDFDDEVDGSEWTRLRRTLDVARIYPCS